MSRRFLTSRAILLVLTAAVSLSVASVAAGQAPTTQAKLSASSTASARGTVPRTPAGHPDLQGNWNILTMTPLERPAQFAGKAALTEAEAKAYVENSNSRRAAQETPNRPPQIGTGPYNRIEAHPAFWLDRATMLSRINGEYRTSMVIDPPDGRVPAMTAEAKARLAAPRTGPGSADIGCYPGLLCADNPEERPLAERCLVGVSAPGPPRFGSGYGNVIQIVQTNDHVMILNEMNHDARIIPLNRPHLPQDIKQWMGDSVARWDGDTLVIETANFRNEVVSDAVNTPGIPVLRLATPGVRVTERLTRVDADTLVYGFTLDDPKTWTRSWTGETAWVKTAEAVFEYACHEGNYALQNIMRGTRVQEKEALEHKR